MHAGRGERAGRHTAPVLRSPSLRLTPRIPHVESPEQRTFTRNFCVGKAFRLCSFLTQACKRTPSLTSHFHLYGLSWGGLCLARKLNRWSRTTGEGQACQGHPECRETWGVRDLPLEPSLSEPGNKSHLVPFLPGPTCHPHLPLFPDSSAAAMLGQQWGDTVDKMHILEKANGIRE